MKQFDINFFTYKYDNEVHYHFKIFMHGEYWPGGEFILGTCTLEDYKKQWREGFERLKTRNSSCIVSCYSLDPDFDYPLAYMIGLYRDDGLLHMQWIPFGDPGDSKLLKEKNFNLQNCYEFIKPIEWINEEGIELLVLTCKYDERQIDDLIERLKHKIYEEE